MWYDGSKLGKVIEVHVNSSHMNQLQLSFQNYFVFDKNLVLFHIFWNIRFLKICKTVTDAQQQDDEPRDRCLNIMILFG